MSQFFLLWGTRCQGRLALGCRYCFFWGEDLCGCFSVVGTIYNVNQLQGCKKTAHGNTDALQKQAAVLWLAWRGNAYFSDTGIIFFTAYYGKAMLFTCRQKTGKMNRRMRCPGVFKRQRYQNCESLHKPPNPALRNYSFKGYLSQYLLNATPIINMILQFLPVQYNLGFIVGLAGPTKPCLLAVVILLSKNQCYCF